MYVVTLYASIIIICSLDFVHNLYNMCVVSWSLLYVSFCCRINHTCSVARNLTVLDQFLIFEVRYSTV